MRFNPILLLAALLCVPAQAQQADPVVPVRFVKGTSAKVIKGMVKGYEGITYAVTAKAGQKMAVDLTTASRSAYFNVTAPGADQALFDGTLSGAQFSGKLPASGVYMVQVYLIRAAARREETAHFSIRIGVTN